MRFYSKHIIAILVTSQVIGCFPSPTQDHIKQELSLGVREVKVQNSDLGLDTTDENRSE